MALRSNDLMIGDWVYGLYPNGSRYKHPFRISAVYTYPSNKGPRIVTAGGYGFQEDHLAPVPITPEILEKNGFEKKLPSIGNAPFYTFSDDDEYYAIAIDEYTDSLWRIEYTNCEMNFPLVRIMVCFVHELQHAIRLLGIEKEIVL